MALRDRRCEKCQFWNPGVSGDPITDGGQCRHGPPIAKDKWGGNWLGTWPVTDKTDWCGSWAPDK